MDIKEYISGWTAAYKHDLTDNIMPFWMEHGLDRKNGGIYTCLDRDGSLMDSTKSVWFQGRFAFICSFAYNNVVRNQAWLDAAKSAIDFIERHCFDENGHMYFSVSANGTPLRKRRYVFSEAFAAMAMSEYALATNNTAYGQRALEIFLNMQKWLTTPGMLEPKYESAVQLQTHSITMILINVASCIRKVIKDQKLTDQINASIDKLKRFFMHPEYKCLLELVGMNGEFYDTNLTRTINPGHCIETSWFLLEEAQQRQWDRGLTDMALTILDWSWQWGWDKEYGGIINFRDCRNLPPQDYSQDMKFWWPQCEAIIATLYGFLATGNEDYLRKHQQVSEWAYSHFPDKEYGEWYGYLHRDGTPAQTAKGNLYKGPFHIPRMMTKAYMLCQEIGLKLNKPSNTSSQ